VSAIAVLAEGTRNKKVAETLLNADSSRGHTVFNVAVYTGAPPPDGVAGAAAVLDTKTGLPMPGYKLWSRLSVVDLAGSERASRTKSDGDRLREAGSINNSLSVLMRCFDGLREMSAHPARAAKKMLPVRESKLTRIFADALGGAGAGRIVMVVNAGPAAADFDETLQALKYGAKARDIKVTKDRSLLPAHGAPAFGYDDHGRRKRKGGESLSTMGGGGGDAEAAGAAATLSGAAAAAAVAAPTGKAAAAVPGTKAAGAKQPVAPAPLRAGRRAGGGKESIASTSSHSTASTYASHGGLARVAPGKAAAAVAAPPAGGYANKAGVGAKPAVGRGQGAAGSAAAAPAAGKLAGAATTTAPAAAAAAAAAAEAAADSNAHAGEDDEMDAADAAVPAYATEGDEEVEDEEFGGEAAAAAEGGDVDDDDDDDDDDDNDDTAPAAMRLPVAAQHHARSGAAAQPAVDAAALEAAVTARVRGELLAEYEAALGQASETWGREREALVDEVRALTREVAALEERLEDSEDRVAGVEAEVSGSGSGSWRR
jgi:hypothetical protein